MQILIGLLLQISSLTFRSDGRRGRHDDREEDTRKRARSPSHDDHDDRRTKPAMYDQRTWERENVQAQYNRSRGRGGRGRGFSRHDTYR